MLREGLNFTLVTGDKLHVREISQGLATLPIGTNFTHLDSCENLVNYLLNNHSPFYHVIMLDMDNPELVGMSCLKAIRANIAHANKIIIGYSRNENAALENQFFIEGGNIFFKYPQNQKRFNDLLKKLVLVNWKIYITGIRRQDYVLRL